MILVNDASPIFILTLVWFHCIEQVFWTLCWQRNDNIKKYWYLFYCTAGAHRQKVTFSWSSEANFCIFLFLYYQWFMTWASPNHTSRGNWFLVKYHRLFFPVTQTKFVVIYLFVAFHSEFVLTAICSVVNVLLLVGLLLSLNFFGRVR